MLKVYETSCKTLLNKSKLSDFTLNCYVGCSHKCIYCYASYMCKFKPRGEGWGEFVEVKINAPQVLAKELNKIKPPREVFMSSVCDGWQPLEAKYKLSRSCLKLVLEADLNVSILTKSSLVTRDFDILSAYKTGSLGMTITTMDKPLQKILEPYASESQDRLNTLKEAQEKGIEIWAFLGPLIPGFTDTIDNLEAVFRALKGLNLTKIYVDRLNPYSSVLASLRKSLLSRISYIDLKTLQYTCANLDKYSQYSSQLRDRIQGCAVGTSLSEKIQFCF